MYMCNWKYYISVLCLNFYLNIILFFYQNYFFNYIIIFSFIVYSSIPNTCGGGGGGEGRPSSSEGIGVTPQTPAAWWLGVQGAWRGGRGGRLEKETVDCAPTDADPKTRRKPTGLRARTRLPQNREYGFRLWFRPYPIPGSPFPIESPPNPSGEAPPHRLPETPHHPPNCSRVSRSGPVHDDKRVSISVSILFTLRAATQPQSCVVERGDHALISLSLWKIPEI